MMFSVCQDDRTWSSKLLDCEDSERPEINNCPNTIYAYTDRSKQTSTVNWTIPTATDNSNKVTIKRTRGPAPGSSFRVGLTEIRYKATDLSNNESPECIFFVAVEEVRCTPPIITDRYMTYRCPDGFTYGSSCHLQCMGRFPLVGNEDIVCEKNSTTDPPRGYWDYGSGKPYCKRIPCRDLPAPINGAMSCDTWMFGRQCQMQCSDKFDIPALGPTAFNGVFTCSEKEGTFKPVSTVPNCTEIRLPGYIETLGEFFYYTGTCGDGTASEQIKSNFIKQMEYLEKNGFAGVCSDSNQCNVGNVSVTCGPSSSRGRRSLDSGINTVRLKRASSEIRVEIRLSSVWQISNSSKSDSFEFAKKIQKQMFGQVQDLSRTGKLTVNGLTPDSESFLLGYSAPLCPEGLSLRMTTLTCVPCTSGSYMTFNHRRKPICTPCPKGFYKENELDVHCTQCPDATSTEETGSTHASDCIDICHPGEYSKSGLSPCTPCDKSTYQNTSMSTKCIQCPKDMATAFTRSTDASNCSEFDVVFKQHGRRIELKKSSIVGVSLGLTIMAWVKSSDLTMDMTLYHSQSFSVRIQDKILIEKASLREWIPTGVSIQSGTWTHVAVVIQKSDPLVSVYINGKQKFISRNSILVSDAELAVGLNDVNMMLNSETISGVFLSGYQVMPQPFSRDQIVEIAKTCSSKSVHSFISMEDLKNGNSSGIEMIVPSKCDNVNECNSNPCHGHTCIDRIKGYTCQCGNGYSGIHCEEKPDFCKHQPCQNGGTCTNTDDGNYNCSCAEGFKGTRCEKKIANGGWSSWSQFSDCSVSCNGGTKVRTRVCNSPHPDPEGIPCNASEATEHASCNSEKCPSCSHLRRRFGNILHCQRSIDDHEVCTVTCRPGYSFVPGHIPLPEYKCGRNTSYEWTGIQPACGEVDIPEQISTITVVSYKDPIPCDKASQASQNLQQKLESSLQCAKNNTCTLAVEAKECLSDHRRKRSVSTQSHHVTLTSAVSEKIDVKNIAKTQKPTDAAKKFMLGVSELEFSVQQLNSSSDMLNLNVNGTIFISTGQITKSVIHCPSGQGRVLFFCANCPPGTHSSSGECVLCNIGTYQDEAGQTECKGCPHGMTTKYVGSQDQIDCAVKGEDSSERRNLSRESADENKTLIIIITTISVLICLGLVIGFTIFGYKKYLRLRRRRISKVYGSLASLSMVSPSEYTSHDCVPMESKPKFSM
ncbi:uncharacterized protein LOC125664654 [Ostrea edulis]|uniref:uncharacterized protein LOC125664654 n=1 Tax=Ostrea edulis TaxID=37623 RepID=UPI0024AED88D|nr:uncharacterized protein LOC125664654 [Ostrea edulis]